MSPVPIAQLLNYQLAKSIPLLSASSVLIGVPGKAIFACWGGSPGLACLGDRLRFKGFGFQISAILAILFRAAIIRVDLRQVLAVLISVIRVDPW
jgi:hypothetical protein